MALKGHYILFWRCWRAKMGEILTAFVLKFLLKKWPVLFPGHELSYFKLLRLFTLLSAKLTESGHWKFPLNDECFSFSQRKFCWSEAFEKKFREMNGLLFLNGILLERGGKNSSWMNVFLFIEVKSCGNKSWDPFFFFDWSKIVWKQVETWICPQFLK